METNETIGNILKRSRKVKRWSRLRVAKKTGISMQTIQRIETGRQEPRYSELAKLANLYEIKIGL